MFQTKILLIMIYVTNNIFLGLDTELDNLANNFENELKEIICEKFKLSSSRYNSHERFISLFTFIAPLGYFGLKS